MCTFCEEAGICCACFKDPCRCDEAREAGVDTRDDDEMERYFARVDFEVKPTVVFDLGKQEDPVHLQECLRALG